MKRIIVFVTLVLAVVVGLKAAPVVAESLIIASENASSVARDRTVDGSAYLAGESVDVQGVVKGDVYCAGQTVTISGTVEGDVICAGQTVTIGGIIHGDVRAAGMNVTLKASVDGSVTLAGASVITDSASKVGRDATITAGTIDLSGSITRDAMLAGQTVALNGSMGRDARIMATTITASSTAKISRNLFYESNNEATLASGVVVGKTQRTVPSQRYATPSLTVADVLMGLLIAVIMFTVLTLLIVFAAPRYMHRVSDVSGVKQFVLHFLIGLVALVVTPVLLLILLVTIVGIYAAIVLGLAVALGTLAGASLVAYRLGRFMLDGRQQPVMNALVGSLALGVLGVIPYIGWLVFFVSTMIGFGMVVMGMRSQYADPSPENIVKKPVRKTKRLS